MSGPVRYGLLLRESNPHHAEVALRTQEHALREAVQERGGVVAGVYRDAGYSGALMDRPAIDALLDAAERGLLDVALGTELSRFCRAGEAEYYAFENELLRHNVTLDFLDKSFADDGSETWPLTKAIAVAMPAVERRVVMGRFRRGRRRAWDEGKHWASRGGYGHDYVRAADGAYHWCKNEREGPWVILMYEMAAAGYSYRAIARHLDEQGAPTRRGGHWADTTVRTILLKPRHKGVLQSGRYETVLARGAYVPREGSPSVGQAGVKRRQVKTGKRLRPAAEWSRPAVHPELAWVSEGLWERANAGRQKSLQTSPRRCQTPSSIHGLVYCGRAHAGSARPHRMDYQGPHQGRQACWRCNRRHRTGAAHCPGYIASPLLEHAVWARLGAIAAAPEALLGQNERDLERAAQHARRWRQRAELVGQQALAAQRAIDAIKVDHYAGTLSDEEYGRLLALAQERYDAAKSECAALAEERVADEGRLTLGQLWAQPLAEGLLGPDLRTLVLEHLRTLALGHLESMEPDERRRHIRQVVEQIIVDETGASMVLVLGGTERLYVHDRFRARIKSPLRFVVDLILAA